MKCIALIDSSVIIEGLKTQSQFKDASKLLEIAIIHSRRLCLNEMILDEVFYWLLKKKKRISDYQNLLFLFNMLSFSSKLLNIWVSMIERYRLKPHDAFILATCKYYQVPYLISLDTDFEEPCKSEGITLINTPQRFEEILKSQ